MPSRDTLPTSKICCTNVFKWPNEQENEAVVPNATHFFPFWRCSRKKVSQERYPTFFFQRLDQAQKLGFLGYPQLKMGWVSTHKDPYIVLFRVANAV